MLRKAYTQLVAEYIAKGYEMGLDQYCSSDSVCHTEMYGKDENIAISLVRGYDIYGCVASRLDRYSITLVVKHFEKRKSYHKFSMNRNHITSTEIVKTFYPVDDDGTFYTDSRDFAESCSNIRAIRYESTFIAPSEKVENPKAIEIAARYLKKQKGFKTVKPSEISVTKHKRYGYAIHARGKSFELA